jgi:hypothetical protein
MHSVAGSSVDERAAIHPEEMTRMAESKPILFISSERFWQVAGYGS